MDSPVWYFFHHVVLADIIVEKMDFKFIESFSINALYDEKGIAYKELERIHLHWLHYTFATRCFEKGMTANTVQEIIRHSN